MLPEGEEKSAAMEAIKAEQQKISQEAEKLQERMEQLAGETPDEGLRESLEDTLAKLQEEGFDETMRQTQQDLQQGDMAAAKQKQQRLGESMREMAEALQQQNSEMFTDEYSAAIDGLQQAFHEGLFQVKALERVQDGLAEISYETLQASPRYKDRVADFSGRVRLSRESLASMRTRLMDIAIASPYLDPDIVRLMAEANDSLDRYLGGLGDQGMVSRSPEIGEAVTKVRRAALAMLDSQDVLQQMAEAMSMEEMMQQLGQISRDQRALNQQTRRMTGGQMPMPLPSPQQMSAQQQALAMQLQKMQQQGSQEGKDGIMGDLGQMSEEMEEISRKIAEGEIDDELLQRQEKLYHRLLDAQNAVKKQGYRKTRKAERGDEELPAAEPAPLANDQQEPTRQRFDFEAAPDDEDVPEEFRDLLKAFYRALSKKE